MINIRSNYKYCYLSCINFLVLFLYLVFYTYISLNKNNFVPDEIHFFEVSRGIFESEYLNSDYFGTFFWFFLGIFPSLIFAKFIFLIMFLFPLIFIWWKLFNHSKESSLFFILIWISMPISLWNGKIVGPEVLNYFIIFLTIYLVHKNYIFISALLLGLAIGIKIDSLYVIVPYVYLLFLKSDKFFSKVFIKNLVKVLFFIFCGYLLCNPFSWSSHIVNVITSKADAPFLLAKNFNRMLFSERWTWDAISYTGFFNYFFNFFSFLIFLFLLNINRKYLFFLILSFLSACFFIINTEHVFIWYFFNFLSVFLFLIFIYFRNYYSSTFFKNSLIILIIFLNFLFNFSHTYKNIEKNLIRIDYGKFINNYELFIKNNLTYKKFDLIVNFSDIPDSFLIENYSFTELISGSRRWEAFVFMYDALNKKTNDKFCEAIENNKSILILYSDYYFLNEHPNKDFSFANYKESNINNCNSLKMLNSYHYKDLNLIEYEK